MTCRMAAGQHKKPIRSPNIHEQYRGKKKRKMESSGFLLNLNSHIDLQWDDNRKEVVSKMEQIGISWKDMSPFIDSVSQMHHGVADVMSIPLDIYGLEDLNEVFSYEVWTTYLSESERKLLSQFLPSGTSAEQTVHSLLEGENFHFGNPYLKWSNSLFTGNLHPDVILQMELRFEKKKKVYYYQLNNYHTGMLKLLTTWNEKWLSCKDPEKLHSEGFLKNKETSSAAVAGKAKVPTPTKRELPQKLYMQKSATDKYISYIKISRAQHEMVKNMKHSSDGIPVMSLTGIIGDMKNFKVHPFENFEEEENKRLHKHWLQVVKEDIPAALELAKDRKSQRKQWSRSLEDDLAEELKLIMHKVEKSNNSENSSEEHAYDGDSREEHSSDADGEIGTDSEYNSTDDNKLDSNPSVDSKSKSSPLVISEELDNERQANEISLLSHSSGTKNQKENTLEPVVSTCSAKQMWQMANVQDSCYLTSVDNNGYTSGELSLGQPQLREHGSDIIDLERDMVQTKAGEPIQSHFLMDNNASLFYENQDKTEVLPTFPRGVAMLSSYQHEDVDNMKQSGLQFLMTNANLPQSVNFPNQLEEQQHLLDQDEVRLKRFYMHPVVNKNVYAANRYPNQGHFPTIEQQGIAALQPSMSSGSVGYNWIPASNQPYSNWYGVDPSNCPSVGGNGSGTADGSLYSVLSNKLSTNSSYDTMSSEQYIQARNFVGGTIPNSQNFYGYRQHQIANPSFHDTAVVPSMNNGSWMNFPRQNPSFNDSLGGLYIRPWNR